MSAAPRWRIAIVDDHERSRAELRAAVWEAGGEVVGEVTRCADVPALLSRVSPDVVIFAVGLADGDGLVAASEVAAECPVVLLTSRTGDELTERAVQAGVMAYLVKPLRRAELAPTLDLAIARFGEARALRQRLEDRKLIERAKGLLMSRYGLTEEGAFHRLRRVAMDRRESMAAVARSLLVSESVTRDVPSE